MDITYLLSNNGTVIALTQLHLEIDQMALNESPTQQIDRLSGVVVGCGKLRVRSPAGSYQRLEKW